MSHLRHSRGALPVDPSTPPPSTLLTLSCLSSTDGEPSVPLPNGEPSDTISLGAKSGEVAEHRRLRKNREVAQRRRREKGQRARANELELRREKEQRRMIKNRESAARSRARKDARMNALELEVAQLQRDNGALVKRAEELTERLAMAGKVPMLLRCRSAPP